jgi:molybdenum cofactor synthesis domain-containing protein
MKQVVINAAVLTISDSRVPVADGISPDKTSGCAMALSAEVAAEDVSGRLLMELLENEGFNVGFYGVVRDEVDEISRAIRDLAERDDINLILTTGGTGISPRDVTPEATRAVIETEIPGIAEAMRIQTLHKTPFAMLSRGLAGLCNRKMVVNLPGSPKGVRECFEAIRPVLEHSIAIIAGGGHE